MSEPIIRSEALGGPPLTRAMLHGQATGWVPAAPRTSAEWKQRAAAIGERFAGSEWLRVLHPALAPSGAAAERLEHVATHGGVLVTTGQQPGLFGGPIYTWSKALSALALADAIEEATGTPTAPLFWAATDDSDVAEASSTVVAVPGGIEVLELPRGDASGERMLATVPLPDASSLVEVLARGAGAAVHAGVLDVARRCYAPGTTIGGAYVALLRALLEPLGVAVLDAAHEAVADAMQPLLREALVRADRIAAAVSARDGEIRARGYEPQVHAVPGLSLVFRRHDGARTRVSITAAPDIAGRPVALGPNVLLRPVAESVILPTIGYAAGPAELAYFAQSTAVADALDRPAPLAVPRWSGTILEPHVLRILERYDLTPDALADPHAAEAALARAEVPRAMSTSLDAFRREIDELAARLRRTDDSDAAQLLPDAVIEGHRRALLHRVERLERRALAAIKRRQSDVARDLATARGALHPRGVRQERALNLLPLLARHGPVLLERMRARAREHADALVEGGRALVTAR